MSKSERMNNLYRALRGLMRQVDCTSVRVEFSGSGDSGSAECKQARKGDDSSIDLEELIKLTSRVMDESQQWNSKNNRWEYSYEEVSRNFPELAEEIAYVMLQDNAGGWEINEGSYGEVNIAFDPPLVTLEFTPLEDVREDEDDSDTWTTEDGSMEVYTYEPDISPMEQLTDGIQKEG